MTRTMGDAIHANVPQMWLARGSLALAAGYVTGSPDVVWSSADWAMFTGMTTVTIDQGYTGSPVASADVRDVEAGAWAPGNAVNRAGWTARRPTIYCSASVLPALAAAGWRGDVWVAQYDNIQAINFPVPAGMNVVAKQYTDTGGGGTFDLSAVFDPVWPLPAAPDPPKEDDMQATLVYAQAGRVYLLLPSGRSSLIPDATDVATYVGAGLPAIGGPTQGGRLLTTEGEAQFLKDFPPGPPAITVNIPPVSVTVPTLNLSGTVTPAV